MTRQPGRWPLVCATAGVAVSCDNLSPEVSGVTAKRDDTGPHRRRSLRVLICAYQLEISIRGRALLAVREKIAAQAVGIHTAGSTWSGPSASPSRGSGPADELARDDQVRKAYLGVH